MKLPHSRKVQLLFPTLFLVHTALAMPGAFAPRVIGIATATPEVDYYGAAEVMLPLWLNEAGFIYSDFAGESGGNQGWFGSMGLGYRQEMDVPWIVGVYLFGDYNHSLFGNNFWLLNPGLEAINETWDLHINGYFPTTRDETAGPFALQWFAGHAQYYGIFQRFNENAQGGDVIVGRRFESLNNARLYTAGYYYTYQQTTPMCGIQFGFEAPINQYLNIVVDNSYDSVNRNQFSVGLKVTWGDIPFGEKRTTESHFLDPIYRHMGTLSTGSGNPTRSVDKMLYQETLKTNLWFFDPNDGSPFVASLGDQNCTFEHPCSGSSFTQSTLNSINSIASNANIYVNTGTVDFMNDYITLPKGMNLYGRSDNFYAAGAGALRPLFMGTFEASGNNRFEDFRIESSDVNIFGFPNFAGSFLSRPTATGDILFSNIEASAASANRSVSTFEMAGGNIFIVNSQVASVVSNSNSKFAIAFQTSTNVGFVVVDNTIFNANNISPNGFTQGLVLRGDSIVTINNSEINALNLNGLNPSIADFSNSGIVMRNNADLTMNNVVLRTNQTGGLSTSNGIAAFNANKAVINASDFNVSASQSAKFAYGTNILNTSTVTFNDSVLTISNPLGSAQRDSNLASTLNNTTATCNGVSC